MDAQKTQEFPSCKTYYLRAMARFKQQNMMDALLDIEEATKLQP